MNWAALNWLDAVFCVALALPLVLGFWRGLVGQIVPILALVVGFAVASRFHPLIAGRLGGVIESDRMANVIAFGALFLLVAVLLGLVGRLLDKLVEAAHLSSLNRTMGGAFGLVKGGIFVLIMAYAIVMFAPEDHPAVAQSEWVPAVTGFAESTLWPLVPEARWEEFVERRDALRDYLDKADEGVKPSDVAKKAAGQAARAARDMAGADGAEAERAREVKEQAARAAEAAREQGAAARHKVDATTRAILEDMAENGEP